jgi:hypothetical protein
LVTRGVEGLPVYLYTIICITFNASEIDSIPFWESLPVLCSPGRVVEPFDQPRLATNSHPNHDYKLMTASSSGSSSAQPSRGGVAPGVVNTEPASTSSPHGSRSTSRLDGVSRSLFAPFRHRKRDSHQILADRTCTPHPLLLCAVEPTPSPVRACQSPLS